MAQHVHTSHTLPLWGLNYYQLPLCAMREMDEVVYHRISLLSLPSDVDPLRSLLPCSSAAPMAINVHNRPRSLPSLQCIDFATILVDFTCLQDTPIPAPCDPADPTRCDDGFLRQNLQFEPVAHQPLDYLRPLTLFNQAIKTFPLRDLQSKIIKLRGPQGGKTRCIFCWPRRAVPSMVATLTTRVTDGRHKWWLASKRAKCSRGMREVRLACTREKGMSRQQATSQRTSTTSRIFGIVGLEER